MCNYTYFSNLPRPLLGQIFSYLPLKDQALTARVCKEWKEVMEKPHLGQFLTYGRRLGVKNLSQHSPSVESFPIHESIIDIKESVSLLISRKEDGWKATLINLSSKEIQTMDLSLRIGSERLIKAAFLLSDSHFFTWTDRSIAVWDVSAHSLLHTLRIPRNPFDVKFAVGAMWISKRSEAGVYKKYDLLAKTFTRSRIFSFNNAGGYDRPLALSVDLKTLYTYQNRGEGFDAPPPALIARKIENFQVLWKRDWQITGYGYGIVGATDDFLIAAVAAEKSSIFSGAKISFILHDTKTGEYLGKLEEDYTHLKQKVKNSFAPNYPKLNCDKFSWLCGDFLAVWIGKALNIWFLPSRELLTTIDLQTLCSPKELDDSHPEFCPIRQVEIKGKEFHLFLSNLENTALRCVKYTIQGQPTGKKVNTLPARKIQKSYFDRSFEIWCQSKEKFKILTLLERVLSGPV